MGRDRDFAQAIDYVRDHRRLDLAAEVASDDELEAIVWAAVRKGGVPAMRLAWQMRRDRTVDQAKPEMLGDLSRQAQTGTRD
jgi:hypothetical protein